MEEILSVGIDWGTSEHQVCVVDSTAAAIDEWRVKNNGDGLSALAQRLLRLTGGRAEGLQVAIERPHGPVVDTLMDRGIKVFFINPKQLDRFRDRYSMSEAKDDRRDAYVLADSLRTDPHCFRALTPDDPLVVELRDWLGMRKNRTQDRIRLENMMRAQLERYYLQFLDLPGLLSAPWKLELLERASSPEKARRIHLSTVEKILKSHRIRVTTGTKVLALLRQRPVVVGPGVVEGASASIQQIAEQLKLIIEQLRTCNLRIDALTEQIATENTATAEDGSPSDVEILRSIPGVGPAVLGALLTDGAAAIRDRDVALLRTLSGTAPVTIQSGRKDRKIVVMRRARNGRLAEAMYHWGRTATTNSPIDRRKYSGFRQRGHSHGRACRQVADGLLRVAIKMLENGTLYESTRRQKPDGDVHLVRADGLQIPVGRVN